MIARTAVALCIANRWFAAASLVLTGAALVHLSESRPLLATLVVAGGVQAYLAFRIELDRVLFESVASGAACFDQIDAALGALRLGRRRSGRSPEERAAGVWRLVKFSALVLVMQLALALAGVLDLA